MDNSPKELDPSNLTRFEQAHILVESFLNRVDEKNMISPSVHRECIEYSINARKLINACITLGDSESSPHVSNLLEVERTANGIVVLNTKNFRYNLSRSNSTNNPNKEEL